MKGFFNCLKHRRDKRGKLKKSVLGILVKQKTYSYYVPCRMQEEKIPERFHLLHQQYL